MKPHITEASQLLGSERQGLRPGSRRHNNVLNAETDETAE
ncbi:MAG: hypothetical protein ACJAS7_000925 [Alpinimonas sp.]|jgi:hypothetical protein